MQQLASAARFLTPIIADKAYDYYTSGSKRNRSKSVVKTVARQSKAQTGRVVSVKKYKKKGPKKSLSLKKRVAKIEKDVRSTKAVKMGREQYYFQLRAANNQCNYHTGGMITTSVFETFMNDLKYYDFANATPAVVDVDVLQPNAVSIYNAFTIKNNYCKFEIANNNACSVSVRFYDYEYTAHTSYSPLGMMTVQDNFIGITSADTNEQVYPGDFSTILSKYVKLKSTRNFNLAPGDMVNFGISIKDFHYSPEISDILSTTYKKGDRVYLMRIEGLLAHGATTDTETGIQSVGVDCRMSRFIDIVYPSTLPYRYYELFNNAATPTGGEFERTEADTNEAKDEL